MKAEEEEGVEVEVEVGESWAAKERPIRGPRLFLIPRLSYLAQKQCGIKSKVDTVPYLSGHHFQVPIQKRSMRNSLDVRHETNTWVFVIAPSVRQA